MNSNQKDTKNTIEDGEIDIKIFKDDDIDNIHTPQTTETSSHHQQNNYNIRNLRSDSIVYTRMDSRTRLPAIKIAVDTTLSSFDVKRLIVSEMN